MTWFPALAAAQDAGDWDLVREGDNVRVYSRDVPGSRFVESKALTTVKARLTSLVAIVIDVEKHPEWIDSIDESRLIEVVGPALSYSWSLSKAPWPVSDRDAIVRTAVEQDPVTGVVTIRSEAAPDRIERRDGVVRIETLKSSWVFRPKGEGFAEVVYQVHNDPGGELPDWLTNSLISDQPYNTLENLRRIFSQPSIYDDASLPFITEPG